VLSVLSHTLFCQPSVQICNGTSTLFATISNLKDPVFVRDPSIQHEGAITNHQKLFDGCLPRAHFLDDQKGVPYFLLHKASVGFNETKCKSKFGNGLYSVDIGAGGSCHRQFVMGISSLLLDSH
jgi:hypothetical protein